AVLLLPASRSAASGPAGDRGTAAALRAVPALRSRPDDALWALAGAAAAASAAGVDRTPADRVPRRDRAVPVAGCTAAAGGVRSHLGEVASVRDRSADARRDRVRTTVEDGPGQSFPVPAGAVRDRAASTAPPGPRGAGGDRARCLLDAAPGLTAPG